MGLLQRLGLRGPPDVERAEARRDTRRLTEALSWDDDPAIRVQAADAMGRIGDRVAVPALIARLHDRDARIAIIRALAKMRDHRAVGPLWSLVREDNLELRYEVFRALKSIGRASIPMLREALAWDDPRVRMAAARALRDLNWSPDPEHDPGVREMMRVLVTGDHRAATFASNELAALGVEPSCDDARAMFEAARAPQQRANELRRAALTGETSGAPRVVRRVAISGSPQVATEGLSRLEREGVSVDAVVRRLHEEREASDDV